MYIAGGLQDGWLSQGVAFLLKYQSFGSGAFVAVEMPSVGDTDVAITSSPNYTANKVRGISLKTSTPSSIPNGSIVGVYST